MGNSKWHVGADEQTVYDERGFEIAEVACYKRIHENWDKSGAKHWSDKEGVTCIRITDQEVLKTATFLAAAPKMYNALLKVKEVMDLEAGKADMDNLYDVVKDALKEASYDIQKAKS